MTTSSFIYAFPARLWPEFRDFTNEYTRFTVMQRGVQLGKSVLFQLEVTTDPEKASNLCDSYVGKSIILMAKVEQVTKVQKLLDATKKLLDLQASECPDPLDLDFATAKVQEAYTAYMQQPDERK